MVDAGLKKPQIIIKKYANRRLYNTGTSSYVTLDHLAQMVKDNLDFRVVDAKSGADITRPVLAQIIMEREAHGENLLPISFLRQLIAMYGDSLQAVVPQYLEASMDAFSRNREQFRKSLEGALSGSVLASFEQVNKQNAARFEAEAAGAGQQDRAQTASQPPGTGSVAEARKTSSDELAEIRAQIAALQSRLEHLMSR